MSQKQQKKPLALEQINEALESDCPKIYFNGFGSALGTGDVTIVLHQNTKPVAVINTTYTVAKTLSSRLNQLIQSLEKSAKTTILTTDDIKEAFKSSGKDDESH